MTTKQGEGDVTTMSMKQAMRTIYDEVEKVPEGELREKLGTAWAENLRLRKLLRAMVDTDGTQIGLIEIYEVAPEGAPTLARAGGVGLVVCTPGDEQALGEVCTKTVAHILEQATGDKMKIRYGTPGHGMPPAAPGT